MLSFLGLSGALTFIKSIPGMIVTGLVVAALAFITVLMLQKSHLETSLAKTQAAVATLKQSNTSLELDNQKKQKEFDAAIAEQRAIADNDNTLKKHAADLRAQAKVLETQREAVRETDPAEFLRQVNRDIGCDFQGFGNAMTCDTLEAPKQGVK